MFGDFPRLIEREHVVGHMLPAVVFTIGAVFLLVAFELLPWTGGAILAFFLDHTLPALALAGLVLWMLSLALMGGNFWLLRIKEGYPQVPFVRPLLVKIQHRRFRRWRKRLEILDREHHERDRRGEQLPRKERQERINLKHRLAVDYPGDDAWLLPFPFGNRLRSFETYPYIMYGLDAIAGWSRLRAVMPAEYVKVVNGAKSQVDFAVNLWAVWWLLLLAYAGLRIYTAEWRVVWFPIVAVACIVICSALARAAVAQWGEAVRSAFDIYLPELRAALRLRPPRADETDHQQWVRVSQALLFRLPSTLAELRAETSCPTCGMPLREATRDEPPAPGTAAPPGARNSAENEVPVKSARKFMPGSLPRIWILLAAVACLALAGRSGS